MDCTSIGCMVNSLEALIAKIRHDHTQLWDAIDNIKGLLRDEANHTPEIEEKLKDTQEGVEEVKKAVIDMLVAGLGPKGRTDDYPPKVDTDGYPLTYQIGTGPEVDSEGARVVRRCGFRGTRTVAFYH